MHRLRWLLLLIVPAVIYSCKKGSSVSVRSLPINAQLTGSWNWVLRYNNGISTGNYTGNPTGDSLTPANTGIHQTLNFSPDGTWNLVQNGTTTEQGNYKIDSALTPDGPIPFLDLIRAGSSTDSLVNHDIHGDTLVLSKPLIDSVGMNYVYVRTSAG